MTKMWYYKTAIIFGMATYVSISSSLDHFKYYAIEKNSTFTTPSNASWAGCVIKFFEPLVPLV